MEHDSTNKPASFEDAQNIMGTALFALGKGAKGTGITLPAVETFRSQFIGKIRSALQDPDWPDHWRQEQVYLLAHAEAMGRRAALLAADEGRTVITQQDIEAARMKVRGHLPIAGRWCPG